MPRLTSHDLDTISRLSRAASDLMTAHAQLATTSGALSTDYVEATSRNLCAHIDGVLSAVTSDSPQPAPVGLGWETVTVSFTLDRIRGMDLAVLELPGALMAALRKADLKTVGDIEARIKDEANALMQLPGVGFQNFKRMNKAVERLLDSVPY